MSSQNLFRNRYIQSRPVQLFTLFLFDKWVDSLGCSLIGATYDTDMSSPMLPFSVCITPSQTAPFFLSRPAGSEAHPAVSPMPLIAVFLRSEVCDPLILL